MLTIIETKVQYSDINRRILQHEIKASHHFADVESGISKDHTFTDEEIHNGYQSIRDFLGINKAIEYSELYQIRVDGGWEEDVAQKEYDGAEIIRIADIKSEQESAGLEKVTIQEADAWILERLKDAQESVQLVTDVPTAKAAMNNILLAMYDIHKKEIPYILK